MLYFSNVGLRMENFFKEESVLENPGPDKREKLKAM